MQSPMAKAFCKVLCVVQLFTWCELPFAQVAPTPAAASAPSPAEVAALADRLDAWFGGLEQDTAEVPRDSFDPKAIVDRVGSDANKLFEWVRDRTALVPYRGALRGPAGVLTDRLGNSLDRSLLLCELLRLAGQEAHLARGTLTAEQAAELWRKADRPVPAPESLPSKEESSVDELRARAAQRYKVDPVELRRAEDEGKLRAERLVEEATGRVAEQTETLTTALGPVPPQDSQAAQAAAIESLREHWWVRWNNSGVWTDLDPASPDSTAGSTLTNVESEMASAELPADSIHRIRIRVLIERWDGSQFEQKPVLSRDLEPARLAGTRIQFGHVPVAWPDDPALTKDEQRFLQAVSAQKEWLPVLELGGETFHQASVLDSGALNESPTPEGMGAGVSSALGGALDALGGGESEPPAAAGILTAEWLEFEVVSPGRAARTFRRDVFDLIGPAARSASGTTTLAVSDAARLQRGLALLGVTELLPLGSRLSPQSVQVLFAQSLLPHRQQIVGLFRDPAQAAPEKLVATLALMRPLPGELYGMALARQAWSARAANLYLDRPNLFLFTRRLAKDASGPLVERRGLDIVANETAVRPAEGVDWFRSRLEQGVLDSNVESLVGSMTRPTISAADVLAQATGQGIESVTLRSATDAGWQKLELPADVRSRISQDVASGYVVIAPKKPIPYQGDTHSAWWRVDPSSGDILAMLESGQGGQFTEYLVILRSFALNVGVGYVTAVGCGATNPSSGTFKVLGCTLCGVLAGALVYIAALQYGAQLAGAIGAWAIGQGGFWTGTGLGAACSVLSGWG